MPISAPAPTILGPVRCVWPMAATLGEGTLWSVREQALYGVDILEGSIFRYRPADGARHSWMLGQNVSALAERESERGLIVSLRHSLAFFDPDTGRLTMCHAFGDEVPGNRFNDGKCDAQGRFWTGSMDFECRKLSGALYCYDAQGQCTRHLSDVDIANGPTWSRDGRTMYFTETGKREISAFDFDASAGTLSRRRPWLRFAGDEGSPDGMTTDAEGRIWIAHWGGSRVTCRDPSDGRELARIDVPALQVTNVAFGGPDLRTLYISSAAKGLSPEQCAAAPQGGLFEVRTDAVGLPAARFAG